MRHRSPQKNRNQTAPSGLLVIGYGNTLRSDDGVGPKVAEAAAELRLPQVRTLACGLLTPELADPIAQACQVVFVDAAVDEPAQVQLRPLKPAPSSQVMAHAANPATMLALARDVFGHVPEAWWLTIPVQEMGIGETLSPLARSGMAEAVAKITELSKQAARSPLPSESAGPHKPRPRRRPSA